MVRDYKKDILSVEAFLDNRPDMAVHSEQAIQSAIYSSAALLNGETNGNIEIVWNYNHSEERNQNDPRYRSDYELGQIVEAFIVQTQYTLNIGNDFSVGGGSYSIGNINSSFSRPIDRDILAPGVVRLLQNARVYQAQSYFTSGEQKDCNECVNYDADCITRNIGDMRYVRKEQSANLSGYIAIINDNGFVDWVQRTAIGVPSDLAQQLDSLRLGVSTNKVNIDKNKENISKNEQRLNQVENVANANKSEITTLKSNVSKNTGDITQIRNQHAEDTTAINNRFGNVEGKVNDIIEKLKEGKFVHIEGDDTSWSSTHSYSIGALVTHNGKIWLSKINDNLNNEPSSTSTQWELFSEVDIDLTKYPTKQEVLEMLDDYLKLSDFETRLNNYYTKSDIDAKLDEKANTSDLDAYVLEEQYNREQKRQDDKIADLQSQITAIDTGKVEGVKVATFTIEAPITSHEVVGVDYAELDNRYVQLTGSQTISGSKTFNNTNGIAIKSGSNVFNVSNKSDFMSVDGAWGILFDNTRSSTKTSILNDHIETPYINIGSGLSDRYRIDKSGEDLRWDNKVLATKEYVDTSIATIPKPDLSTLAKLREDNIFEGQNTFDNVTYFNGFSTFNRIPICEITPTNNNHLTNKQYVDEQIKKNSLKSTSYTYTAPNIRKGTFTFSVPQQIVGIIKWEYQGVPSQNNILRTGNITFSGNTFSYYIDRTADINISYKVYVEYLYRE